MILVGFSFMQVVYGVLYTSLGLLVVIVLYRLLLKRLSRGAIDQKNYCELHSLEVNPGKGELPFYFISGEARRVRLTLLDAKMNFLQEIASLDCKVGGNIVRFDSTKIPDGNYFYCLETDNQKVMKKMSVKNT